MQPEDIKLTQLSSCAGCAAKLGQKALLEILYDLPQFNDPNLIVGSSTGDDAAVYKISDNVAMVQTTDFFTPVVDDAFDYGQIAATNAISDVYAMGGKPVTALAVTGLPSSEEHLPRHLAREILRGGAEKVVEAECSLAGGHTIRLPEPVYGLAVTGLIDPNLMMTNAGAKPGDRLVLTKPLGTGIITTGIKRGLATPQAAQAAIDSMKTLNKAGIAMAKYVKACTDVTGFGITGHLRSFCKSSNVSVVIQASSLPVLDEQVWELIGQDCIPGGSWTNRDLANDCVDWNDCEERHRVLLSDAQTSGGLLFSIPQEHYDEAMATLQGELTLCITEIGQVVEPFGGDKLIRVD